MVTITSWNGLREAIGTLDPEGRHGFEGFVAGLFEAETGTCFHVARKGDQPVGDAYSPRAAVALQAKLYDVSTLKENEVEGDVDRILREAPVLDVVVIATTAKKGLAQLAARLTEKTHETGLDVLLFALNDELTTFGSVCVAHWDVVQTFVPDLDPQSQVWATAELGKPETQTTLQTVRAELRGLATRQFVSEACRHQLATRFRGGGAGAHTHNRVVLSEGIARPGLEQQLQQWWDDGKEPIAVLQGEEGMGKTWVAAAFVDSLPKADAPVAFWLDSLAWANVGRVEELINTALADIVFADETLRARIKRKILRQWDRPVLLVLDGANERGAWMAAERILQDYSKHQDELSHRVRLLFTSRQLDNRPSAGPNFWKGHRIITVAAFDDTEFRAALTKAAPDLTPEAFTAAVRELAVIPRYFSLCVRLRGRLASLQHLNKQILLWADLREKLANRDPQIAALGEELHGNPEEILAYLARQAGWPSDGQRSIATEELQRSFPNFLKVRADLTEQRIVLDAAFDHTKLSADHVVLGWALVLQRLAKQHAMEDPEQLRERLLRELEPAASNDDKVRAVHVAALLAFLDEFQSGAVTLNVRATLLSLWAVHHNAAVSIEALKFFVLSDLMAYARAVEVLFRSYLSGNLESTLIAPLARSWRDQVIDAGSLRKVLERWLRLIYPGNASGSRKGDETPPAHFVPAESPEQLRLSYAAISVISFRPDFELLSALVDCNHTGHFCYMDVGTGDRDQRFPIKSQFDPLGVLLRWSYTEAAIPHLQSLAAKILPGGEEAKDFRWFARLLRMAELPSEIGKAQDVHSGGRRQPRQEVEGFRQWLRKEKGSEHVGLGFGSLERLAVRDDLPPLEMAEVEALCVELRHRLTDAIVATTSPSTMENREFNDLLPWLARYAPSVFEKCYDTLWQHALGSSTSTPRFLGVDELMPATDLNGELVRALLSNATALLSRPHGEFDYAPLTELMLLHANLDQLMEWLRLLQDMQLPRGGGSLVGLLPLPRAFEALAPSGLADKARWEFEDALTRGKEDPADLKFKLRARHWLAIYSYVARPTKDVGEWALSLLKEGVPDHHFRFSLFHLLTGCTDGGIFRRALEHPALHEYHFGYNAWRWARRFTRDTLPSLSLDALRNKASFTVSGWLLHCAELDDELCKWGNELARAALSALDVDTSHLAPETKIEFEVDETGKLGGRGFESPPSGGGSMHSVMSSAWGIDRSTTHPSPTQADLDATCDTFRKDVERLRSSPRREFTDFNAAGPLFHWSELEPDAFATFAEQFLRRLREKDSCAAIDLSFFASAVAVALLRVKPERAMRLREWSTPGMLHRVLVFRGAFAWETEKLWSSDLNKSDEVMTLRRRLLIDAPNDEELMWHVAAAETGDNAPEMIRLADEYLAAPAARERALGITLLAFQGDDGSLAKLAQRRDSDASLWVREHAAWAWEVCALERACRRRYREVLQANTLSELAAGLAELRNAFTPMVWSWRHRLESDTNSQHSDRRINGYLNLFWYHWGSSSSRKENFEIFGRRLREYCRGEQLKDGVTSRQWPWWQLE